MTFKGKQILITGASRGIGEALALELAAHGAHLHLLSRKIEPKVREKCLAAGAQSVHTWDVDLSSPQEIDEFLKKLHSEFTIDVLVNNAGLLTGGLFEKQSLAEIHRMIQVNVNAVFALTHSLLPGMLERKSGLIINNASVSGKMFFPCASTYAASKAAIVAFSESLKQEIKGTGVSCILMITPGVKTEMFDEISKLYGENLDLSFMRSIPASAWAKRVVEGICSGEDTIWPEGSARVGVWLGHHLPGVFQSIVGKKFSR
jgi:short-subunit dehydrogenase